TIFKHARLGELAEAVVLEVAHGRGQAVEKEIMAVGRERDLPLSFAQQRLWFIDQMEPGNVTYNIISGFRIGGKLSGTALQKALDEVVRRHEVLRTHFVSEQGRAMQRIESSIGTVLEQTDLSGRRGEEWEAEVIRRTEDERRKGFDLGRSPLVRGQLLRFSEEEYVLLLSMHHIVSDGWSAGILVRELTTLYEAYREGRESPLPELKIQYAD